MDIYSLAITHIRTGARPAQMSARAEERYYSNQFVPPRLSPGVLRSMAMTTGVILILGIVLI